jgi:two-component system, OmpR family, sensor histidine kinase KdpD
VPRAPLRIYLGAAPGVGKTFAMLNEGYRRFERGTDVVVGVVETHGRAGTQAQLRDLEQVPRRTVEYRGTTLQEMDVDAVLARRPHIVLVDELAHTNAPGSRHEKRWQDVDELLDAGIEVITTVNVQHLESLNDVVAKITGTQQRETVPDAFVRRADQIELVDMSPEALRRRMAHGNIYPAERIDAALSNYFRPGNLGALRELALLWVADRVEETLAQYLDDHGITAAWETRERVVVAMTGRPGGEALVRRAARMAGRAKGDLIGVHVVRNDGIADENGASLADQRTLVTEFGGTVHEVSGDDAAEALVHFARAEKATQLVLGASGRSRWHEWWHGSFVSNVIRLAGDMDVHVIARNDPGPERERNRPPRRVRRTVASAWLLAAIALPLLTVGLAPQRSHLALSTILLLFLSLVLLVAALGGRLVAGAAAVAASLLVNWYFVPPIHTFTIDQPENIASLVVFLAVALTVGTFVDLAARRSIEARRARVEAEALTRAASQLIGADPVPGLLEEIRATFGLQRVRLARSDGGSWTTVDAVGTERDSTPTAIVPLAGGVEPAHRLELHGGPAIGEDRRLLRVLADQVAVALEARTLQAEVDEATVLADIDALRTALLRAVSHDLRTPLASIKAMVSGLRDPSVDWRPDQIATAHATIEEETDRLTRLVANLLDASRLQTGAMAVVLADVDLVEPIRAAIHAVPDAAARTQLVVADHLPHVIADAALVERIVANLLSNALRHSPSDAPVRVVADRVGDLVHLCVIDRGPGIPPSLRSKVLVPFQRLGDESIASGVGLGLSIAQGFVDALHGTLTLDDTPGGGLTVTIGLPVAEAER